MNFMSAVEAMKLGKKVKRKHWYSFIHGLAIAENLAGERFKPIFTDIEATEWEVFEEKKTLSDKISTLGTPHLFVKDVKQALKEFLEEYTGETLNIAKSQSGLYLVAKKHFGEELLK